MSEETSKGNFIEQQIYKDLDGVLTKVHTRFPPEPNGYLHIGHVKSILLNYGLATTYGGKFNLRFDDTNPAKEEVEFVNSIKDDIKWLGVDCTDRIFFASNYFDEFYNIAVKMIKDGKAYVCDLNAEEIRLNRGTLTTVGTNSPYRDRTIEENLELFTNMKNGKYNDGEKTLRAKIDMSSPNINMRDPIMYRIAKITHHNTGDKWCIYPMYDFAHPLEDAIEHITHSLCTLEFEDHRPLYEFYINNSGLEAKPRQMEFAKLAITNTMTGKRYLRKLVEDNEVDGWDDPRLATISAMRRRGYTKEALADFCNRVGISKANNRVDVALLEHCVRDDLKLKAKGIMTVINPLKVVITNYPENKSELLTIENNAENEEMGTREVPFGREIYIEKEDFQEDAPPKFFRLTLDKEVRLKGAYFIKCNEVIKDINGEIIELHCTYDVETKSGSGFTARKVKGTIHWVYANEAIPIETRLYDYLFVDDNASEHGITMNKNSLQIFNSYAEPSILKATANDRFQFIRNGYFALDTKRSEKDKLVFTRTVSLKSSFK